MGNHLLCTNTPHQPGRKNEAASKRQEGISRSAQLTPTQEPSQGRHQRTPGSPSPGAGSFGIAPTNKGVTGGKDIISRDLLYTFGCPCCLGKSTIAFKKGDSSLLEMKGF